MSAPVVAVIDIGSNSMKVPLATRRDSGFIEALKTHTVDARISAGISQAVPRLSEEGMARGLSAIQELLALAAPPWCGRGGLFLARPRWSGGPPRRRVWLGGGRPGGGFAPPLAGGGALGGAPAVRVVGSAGRWFFSLSFSFCSRYFFPPGAAFLAALAGIKDTKFS